MTQPDRSKALVQALLHAYAHGSTLPAAPSSSEWSDLLADPEAAYAVQHAVAVARGCPAEGVAPFWKSGGGSREAVLTHAALSPAFVRRSPADFSDTAFHAAGIEAEIALRLGQAVSPGMAAGLDMDGAAALIDAMAVSVEIVDSRWAEGSKAPALLRLADAQSHGALVIGEWLPFAPLHDWSAQRCEQTIGDQPAVVRTGSHPLGHPVWGLPAWLRHLSRHGQTVPAGTAVTTGTWTGLLPARSGQTVSVVFEGIAGVSFTL